MLFDLFMQSPHEFITILLMFLSSSQGAGIEIGQAWSIYMDEDGRDRKGKCFSFVRVMMLIICTRPNPRPGNGNMFGISLWDVYVLQ